jgi:predicted MFS family arabinose efflux permease
VAGTERQPQFEDAEDAVIDGDVPVTSRRAFGALSSHDFRVVWIGTLSSNVGTWMQTVALGAFIYDLTHSAAFVALITFAQLGPILPLSPLGGVLADRVDRRRLLIVMQSEQLVFSFVLAVVAASDHPDRWALFAATLGVGLGNALSGAPLASLLPNLVEREDLPGAISLQSVQMNLSRVIGPAIGGLLLPLIHPDGIFAVNAVTYLFAVIGLLLVQRRARPIAAPGLRALQQLGAGFEVARRDHLVRMVLLTVTAVSFFCLPFIGLMPVIAARNLQMNVKGAAYGFLYAVFGLGATIGAWLVGTVFADRPRGPTIRAGLACFSVSLIVFALLRSAAPSYPAIFVVGLTYFLVITSLSTTLQEHLEDDVRGRVMALWVMGFGGTVPIGLLAAGQLTHYISIGQLVVGGGVIAMALAAVVDLRPGRVPWVRALRRRRSRTPLRGGGD